MQNYVSAKGHSHLNEHDSIPHKYQLDYTNDLNNNAITSVC